MNLIKISNKYSVNIEEYEKIRIGDIFPSKNELLRNVCYPTIENVGTTEKRLFPIIDKIIIYEKVKGYEIKVTSIEPAAKATEIIEKELKKKIKPTEQTITAPIQRQNYEPNRTYLLNYIIYDYFQKDNLLYLTAYQIIKIANIFAPFYYDYCDIHYDEYKPSFSETQKISEFAKVNSLPKDYLITVMNELNNIVFDVFNRDNIFSWAWDNVMDTKRVLVKGITELDDTDRIDIESNYINPLKIKGVPAKSIIKQANINYRKAKQANPIHYKWFYYTYKFTKSDYEIIYTNCSDTDLEHNRKELNRKIIERLRQKAIDPNGGTCHKKNKEHLEYIIGKIAL